MALIPKILIVSNLQSTSRVGVLRATQQRWEIALEAQPAKAIERWVEELPDLVLCELDSDSISLDVVTQLREEAVLPILLLTANHSDPFLLRAYEAGVDECILKPIPPSLLEAKVKAWLRHTSSVPVDVLETLKIDDLELIPSDRSVILENKDPVRLTNLDLRLLYYLMGRPGRILTTKELCQRVWRHQSIGDPATLKNLVYRFRTVRLSFR